MTARVEDQFNGYRDEAEVVGTFTGAVANLSVLKSSVARPECQITTEYADLSSVTNIDEHCRRKPEVSNVKFDFICLVQSLSCYEYWRRRAINIR